MTLGLPTMGKPPKLVGPKPLTGWPRRLHSLATAGPMSLGHIPPWDLPMNGRAESDLHALVGRRIL